MQGGDKTKGIRKGTTNVFTMISAGSIQTAGISLATNFHIARVTCTDVLYRCSFYFLSAIVHLERQCAGSGQCVDNRVRNCALGKTEHRQWSVCGQS